MQKAVSKFRPFLAAIVQQLELINKNKKELKKIPVFKEIKKLSTEAVSALLHAVSASCQQRKDAIKSELTVNFTVSMSQLILFLPHSYSQIIEMQN